jgi:hypothetical protein
MLRPPYKRPQVMARLKRLYDAWARGHFPEAQGLLAQLPKDVRAVIALCQYLGKLGDLNARSYHRRLYRLSGVYVGRAYNLADLTDEEHQAIFRAPKPELPPEILEGRPYSVIKSIDWETGTIEFVLSAELSPNTTTQPEKVAAQCDSAAPITPTIVNASCQMDARISDLATSQATQPERYDDGSESAQFFPFVIEGEL